MKPLVHLMVIQFLLSSAAGQAGTERNPRLARQFLTKFNKRIKEAYNKYSKANWAFFNDITLETQQAIAEAGAEVDRVFKELGVEARTFYLPSKDPSVDRELRKALAMTASSAMNESKLTEFSEIQNQMMMIQNTGYDSSTSMMDTEDLEEKKVRWKAARDNTGKKYKNLYHRYVELKNEAAILNGFKDAGEEWRAAYNQSDTEFLNEVHRLYDRIRKYYKYLHTYVKNGLKKIYPAHVFPKSGHIPAHLLGSSSWEHVFKKIRPHIDINGIDVTFKMKERKYTVKKMFDKASEFYKSLGLEVPPKLWSNSRMEKPKNFTGNMICHPTFWDFTDGQDLRLSMCAEVNHYYIKAIYHEMGHAVYAHAYRHLSIYDIGSANEAFHEAIGDIMGMSFESPIHLKALNFIDDDTAPVGYNEKTYLYKKALVKFPLLIETMVIDLFRWGVFSGKITPDNYNKEWWKLQCKYKGISPPTNRSKDDFDAGIYFHMAADVSVIRYYFGTFLEYHLYYKACYLRPMPLHRCDISVNGTEIGKKFRRLMRSGTTRPWQDVLQEFTTSDRRFEASPMALYYRPIYDFLKDGPYEDRKYWDDECDPDINVE